jgi:DNA helicase-2/ATP-dependent DNA helicase PcrA
MVMAGPGTGKTRTLTCRLAALMAEKAARPDQILAITYTHKAAEELRSRVVGLCGEMDIPAPSFITTFHGFCFRLLQEEIRVPFHLISEQEAGQVLKETVRDQISDFPAQAFKELARRISQAKNALIPPDSLETLPSWEACPQWISVYRAYQEKLALNQWWDFDELLVQTVRLLEKDGDLHKKLQARFPYIFIDEFQDINRAQYRLFQLLTKINGDWMIIGDPHQAIYGFRGASADFFSLLRNDCPSLTELALKETFRLPQTILLASCQVLAASSANSTVPLISFRKGETKIPVAALSSAEEEGEYITRVIEEEMGGLSFQAKGQGSDLHSRASETRSFADFAVLYRLHAQGEFLAQAFLRKGIPFQRIREVHWAERPEVRICLRWLQTLPVSGLTPGAALDLALTTENSELHPTAIEGVEALKKLRLEASTFKGSLAGFIETLSIQTGLDTYEPDQERVKLLTLHGAKGLEFPVVIIAGCEGNLLPLSLLKESDPEEERRLFYVGVTRAREKLFLTWVKRRFLFGQKLVQTISPFIDDMDHALINTVSPKPINQGRPRKKQLSLF